MLGERELDSASGDSGVLGEDCELVEQVFGKESFDRGDISFDRGNGSFNLGEGSFDLGDGSFDLGDDSFDLGEFSKLEVLDRDSVLEDESDPFELRSRDMILVLVFRGSVLDTGSNISGSLTGSVLAVAAGSFDLGELFKVNLN